jgi:hypothetical protein
VEASIAPTGGNPVLMRVVEKPSSEPTSDDEGETLWSASYSETRGEDSEGLSGSILSTILPDFVIGTWYSFNSFREKLDTATIGDQSSWTMLEIMSKDILGPGHFEMQVQQELAALMICRAVLAHLEQTGRRSAIWIRIE